MVKKQVMLTFSQEQVREPIIYNLSNQFQIVTNIHRADIADERGWAIVELEGDAEKIEQGIVWMTARGVRVDPAP